MLRKILADSIKRELHKLSERYIYIFAMILIPISVLLMLTSLMSEGLPLHIPTAIVDLDNTVETRAIVRNLKSSPEVEITQAVFDQVMRYNMVLRVDYLVVSNGLRHYCCRMDYARGTYRFLREIPRYEEL